MQLNERRAKTATRRSRRSGWAFALGVAAAIAASEATALLVVAEPWIRVSADRRSAEGYMQLRSTEEAAIVGLTSDASPKASMRGGSSNGAPVAHIRLPPGQTVMLAPGGQRFVLSGLDRRLQLGDRVLLTLLIVAVDGTRQQLPVNAEVRLRSPTDDHLHGHRH